MLLLKHKCKRCTPSLLRLLKNRRKWLLAVIDTVCFVFSFALVLSITFLSHSFPKNLFYLKNAALFYVVLMLCRCIFKVYANIWRYASAQSYLTIVISDFVGGFIALMLSYVWKVPVG